MTANKAHITWRAGRRASYIFFSGHLDATLPSPNLILHSLKPYQPLPIVLDFNRADSADTRAMEWLEQFAASAEARGFQLRVVAPKGSRLRRLLEMLRFSRFVLVLGSLREALSFGKAVRR